MTMGYKNAVVPTADNTGKRQGRKVETKNKIRKKPDYILTNTKGKTWWSKIKYEE